ncbi:TRAP transporter small permease [Flexithrix dorotheae]|uniref:TRAP transporter small permease n=1 Tax=Flexithrix dorotheae TaxID=70993 RepID=UPI00037AA039|nr:TRAP transporter small permease [Flexithrix dorotheae]
MIKKVNLTFSKLLFRITNITAILFFLIIILGIISRFIIKVPILASIELSRLLFVWSCFFAAALTYQRKAHIAITIFTDRLSNRVQHILGCFTYSIILLFVIILLFYSSEVVYLLWHSDLPMLGISQGWFYVPLPIVSVLMLSFTLEFLQEEFNGLRVKQQPIN